MTNSESNYVAIIREICAEEGIELQSFSFDWIFRLTKNGKTGFILGYQFGLNSASVNSICCDKSAASELMTALGIPNISHILFASPPEQKFVGNFHGGASRTSQKAQMPRREAERRDRRRPRI